MAVIRNIGEDTKNIPTVLSLGALLCLVFAVLGIKLKWFRHNLVFESLPTEPIRRDIRDSRAKTTGVYTPRNLDEEEIYRPATLPPIKIKHIEEDSFNAYIDTNGASTSNVSKVIAVNEKSSKTKSKSVVSKVEKPTKKPTKPKEEKAKKEKLLKAEKAAKPKISSPQTISRQRPITSSSPTIDLRPKSSKSAEASPSPKDKMKIKSPKEDKQKERTVESRSKSPKSATSSPSPKSAKKIEVTVDQRPKSSKSATSSPSPKSAKKVEATVELQPKSPKSPSSKDKKKDKESGKLDKTKSTGVSNLSKSEPNLGKIPKPQSPKAKPEKEKSGGFFSFFSSNKAKKVQDPDSIVELRKPAKKTEKPVKEKKVKPEKKEQMVVVPPPTIAANAQVVQPPVEEAAPKPKPRTTLPKTSNPEVAEPTYGILQFVENRPREKLPTPSTPDDDFGSWGMVTEHRKSITHTAMQVAPAKPPPSIESDSGRLKEKAAAVVVKPKTMREMKKLSKEHAELKMRKSNDVEDTEA